MKTYVLLAALALCFCSAQAQNSFFPAQGLRHVRYIALFRAVWPHFQYVQHAQNIKKMSR